MECQPTTMYVCICNGITERQIQRAIAEGMDTLPALQEHLGVASQCGGCSEHALMLLGNATAPALAEDNALFYSVA